MTFGQIGLIIAGTTGISTATSFFLNKLVSKTRHETCQDKKMEAIETHITIIQEHNEKQDKKIEHLEATTTETNLSMKAIETDVKWLRAYMEATK